MDPSSSHWDWLPPEIQEIILDRAAWMHWVEKMRIVRWQLLITWARIPASRVNREIWLMERKRTQSLCMFCSGKILTSDALAYNWTRQFPGSLYFVHSKCRIQFIADKKATSS